MYDTPITVSGRLVADPVLRQTKDGAPMTTFRIASNARRPSANAPGGFEDGPTSFYNVSTFRTLGTNAAIALHKGDPVVVTGQLVINEFDRQDGSRGTSAEITARSVGHDLTWGITAFRKVARGVGVMSEAQVAGVRAASDAMTDAMVALGEEGLTTDHLPGQRVDTLTGEVLERHEEAA